MGAHVLNDNTQKSSSHRRRVHRRVQRVRHRRRRPQHRRRVGLQMVEMGFGVVRQLYMNAVLSWMDGLLRSAAAAAKPPRHPPTPSRS